MTADEHPRVAVIGAGVVGCAVAHALARRGVRALLLEARDELALGASATNSGILHTGFDSLPGELETTLILRSAQLREQLLGELGVPVWRCGALLTPRGEDERLAVRRIAQNARENGVPVELQGDGSLGVPGESLTDPVAFVFALAGGALAGGAQLRLGSPVAGLARGEQGGIAVRLLGGEELRIACAVNCAGLFADEVARMAGEKIVQVYPRKGEFVVFAAPEREPLERILLPAPSTLGKGVLVFPTVDRSAIVAGPTAREREDKEDWSVEPDAAELILARAQEAHPPLRQLRAIGAYAGLRPAGRDANYAIERSRCLPGLVHVAAIRSTGLSASLGIGEHVAAMLAQDGHVVLDQERPLPRGSLPVPVGPWWQRVARSRGYLGGQP